MFGNCCSMNSDSGIASSFNLRFISKSVSKTLFRVFDTRWCNCWVHADIHSANSVIMETNLMTKHVAKEWMAFFPVNENRKSSHKKIASAKIFQHIFFIPCTDNIKMIVNILMWVMMMRIRREKKEEEDEKSQLIHICL